MPWSQQVLKNVTPLAGGRTEKKSRARCKAISIFPHPTGRKSRNVAGRTERNQFRNTFDYMSYRVYGMYSNIIVIVFVIVKMLISCPFHFIVSVHIFALTIDKKFPFSSSCFPWRGFRLTMWLYPYHCYFSQPSATTHSLPFQG